VLAVPSVYFLAVFLMVKALREVFTVSYSI